MRTATLEDVSAKPGTKAYGNLTVAEHPDGSPEKLPFILASGASNGPCLWITGCEHGDETLATATIIEFLSRLDPRKMKGTIVALPVLDSTAFNVKRRFSPIDSYDFSRAYPGFANGWLAQQVTYKITALMKESAEYVINVHNGIPGILDVSPYCVATYTKKEQWESGLKDFTESFLFDKIIHWIGTSTERGERTSTMMSTLMKDGIPSFVPEVGPDTKGGIKTGVRGFENSLRYLGMLPGKALKLKSYQSFPDVIHIFPTRGGVFSSHVDLDDEVEAGQKIASIRNFNGEITEELVSPADGVVVVVWTNPVIGSGDFAAFEIATFEEFKQPWPGER
jgi:predicted deacylase